MHYDGSSWSESNWQWGPIRSLWGKSGTDIYAVGNGIYHYDGINWSQSYVGSSLFGVWGTSANDIYAVGADGKILHFDGTAWSTMNSGINNRLYDVWGSFSSDVFAVGEDGIILHYDGQSWSSMTSGISTAIYGVWGAYETNVYAVGEGGIILHYNGDWSVVPHGLTTETLKSIWGSSETDIYVVGTNGTFLHYNGVMWSTLDLGVFSNNNMLMVNTITAMDVGTITTLSAVWGSSSSNIYAVGDGGILLHANIETQVPTSIELSSFNATPESRKIILRWTTETEVDNAGFNIYRAASEDGTYTKINASLIPVQGSPTQGASYEFTDADVKNRKMYYYKLEDIDLNGKTTMHGPVKATPRMIYGVGK
jgi:hypothetical protein